MALKATNISLDYNPSTTMPYSDIIAIVLCAAFVFVLILMVLILAIVLTVKNRKSRNLAVYAEGHLNDDKAPLHNNHENRK
ncbi:hypothetical protein ABK040_009931 [Willaertia magna]